MTRRTQGKRAATRDFEQFVVGSGRCSCGKLRFLTKAAAKKATRRIKSRSGRLHAYRCGEFWHVGHLPGGVKRGEVPRAAFEPKREP